MIASNFTERLHTSVMWRILITDELGLCRQSHFAKLAFKKGGPQHKRPPARQSEHDRPPHGAKPFGQNDHDLASPAKGAGCSVSVQNRTGAGWRCRIRRWSFGGFWNLPRTADHQMVFGKQERRTADSAVLFGQSSIRWIDHHVLRTLGLIPGAAALLIDQAAVVDRDAVGGDGTHH